MNAYTGGKQVMIVSAGVGVVALGLTAFGVTRFPIVALSSCLLGFAYWTGLAIASLLLVAGFRALDAPWTRGLRRQTEQHASAVLVCALLFAGLAVKHTDPAAFAMQGAACFVVFAGSWLLIDRWPSRAVASVVLPSVTVAAVFASVEWLGGKTGMLGVYFLAGAVVSGLALLMLMSLVPTDDNLHASKTTLEQIGNLAALMLAASCAWGYAGFAVYRGTPASGAWLPVVLLLGVGRFAMPVLALASHEVRHNRQFLTSLSVWILALELVDLIWVIKPALGLEPPDASLAWTDLTAWLGAGGVCVAFVIWRMRGSRAVLE